MSDTARHEAHIAMLVKSESAINYGNLTVVPLGFAVDVAMQLIASARKDELARYTKYMQLNNLSTDRELLHEYERKRGEEIDG